MGIFSSSKSAGGKDDGSKKKKKKEDKKKKKKETAVDDEDGHGYTQHHRPPVYVPRYDDDDEQGDGRGAQAWPPIVPEYVQQFPHHQCDHHHPPEPSPPRYQAAEAPLPPQPTVTAMTSQKPWAHPSQWARQLVRSDPETHRTELHTLIRYEYMTRGGGIDGLVRDVVNAHVKDMLDDPRMTCATSLRMIRDRLGQ